MTDHRHETPYRELMRLIDAEGGVPCQKIPALFFPEDYADKETRDRVTATAKRMCNTCPLKAECFAYAIEAQEPYGIWAGTLPTDR
tara:strand:- start:1492 stop:1749 length:258 start_codon:yes stop_codon:yes gene_type:complete